MGGGTQPQPLSPILLSRHQYYLAAKAARAHTKNIACPSMGQKTLPYVHPLKQRKETLFILSYYGTSRFIKASCSDDWLYTAKGIFLLTWCYLPVVIIGRKCVLQSFYKWMLKLYLHYNMQHADSNRQKLSNDFEFEKGSRHLYYTGSTVSMCLSRNSHSNTSTFMKGGETLLARWTT